MGATAVESKINPNHRGSKTWKWIPTNGWNPKIDGVVIHMTFGVRSAKIQLIETLDISSEKKPWGLYHYSAGVMTGYPPQWKAH